MTLPLPSRSSFFAYAGVTPASAVTGASGGRARLARLLGDVGDADRTWPGVGSDDRPDGALEDPVDAEAVLDRLLHGLASLWCAGVYHRDAIGPAVGLDVLDDLLPRLTPCPRGGHPLDHAVDPQQHRLDPHETAYCALHTAHPAAHGDVLQGVEDGQQADPPDQALHAPDDGCDGL